MKRKSCQSLPKPFYNRWRVWVVLFVTSIISIAAASCSSTQSANHSTTTTTSGANTTTTASGATPTTAAPNSPTAEFDKKYGSFAATSHSGSSDEVVPIPSGLKAGLVTATYSGTSNFQIVALDGSNEMVDLLVNEIGAYSGTTALGLGLSSSRMPISLQVTASGPWTIKISPISTAPALTSPAQGQGDAVYLWTGKATTWTFAHQGQSNFIVTNHGSGILSYDLLVNEIGPFNGTKAVKAGPAVTAIKANGPWSITY